MTLASIADAVITVDTAGSIEYMNPVAERLTGWPHDEARGVPVPKCSRVSRRSDRRADARSGRPRARRRRDDRVGRQRRAAAAATPSPIAIDYASRRFAIAPQRIVGAVLVVPGHEPRAPVCDAACRISRATMR